MADVLKFTFQYVSINTSCQTEVIFFLLHLHSNMFLLILLFRTYPALLVTYLHSNMFLLIQKQVHPLLITYLIYIPICFY